MVVVFTFVLVRDVIVVTQWSRLFCCARNTYAFVCCFSRCLTYPIKWACSAVAGMEICGDGKIYFNGNCEMNIAYMRSWYYKITEENNSLLV